MPQDLVSARVLQTATTLVEQEFDIAQPCTSTLVISWSLTRHALLQPGGVGRPEHQEL